ncbi:MAG: chromosome segregation protein SMC [Candidatus Marinimicrobia bacterium]|nr:chromosome segregation protein SMC [Candidatus Neomarinimicrobiota bacterium]RPG05401.1 MAG: chromosome segregation protein SMC [Pelagibacteraceae bacterium TMED247]|tara:strand:+ start:10070 stop:12649 length:2580 start_codon:yes stop_codon:yes gene_type:complete
MKFKKMEMLGFKSFFDKTHFFIENGLTGIVGPNGCGKSNIVEALRWCMGETSAKSIRGSGMEDVIFSGTSNRPSKNISEVAITIDNSDKEGQGQYLELDEVVVRRKIERDKGSKYYINDKEVRARDAQTFFADLSTGAHSPSMISQGKIGMIVTAKPSERKSVLEEAAGISGIHLRRHEAETRLNAAENNLKRADELKRQQEKQLENLEKQAEEATKYKEISQQIKAIEAGLYYLKIQEIDKERDEIKVKSDKVENEITEVKKDLNQNNTLVEEENKKIQPLRDKKMENLSKIQKLNLEIANLNEREKDIKELNKKLLSNIKLVESDLEREKSISLDASLNEKRILEEKNELIKTERELIDIEKKSEINLDVAKQELKDRKIKFDNFFKKKISSFDFKGQQKILEDFREINAITSKLLSENKIEEAKKNSSKLNNLLQDQIKNIQNFEISDLSLNFRELIEDITVSQEKYASIFGKNESIHENSIKRKERIKNIDQELENWKDLKLNSEKMLLKLNERKRNIELELEENQKNPEKLAISKGQNLQNLENTKKNNEELEVEIQKIEEQYESINKNLKSVQEKFTVLREGKARLEATIEGIDQRKMDLIYMMKNELKIENVNNLLGISDLTKTENLPSVIEQEEKLEKMKKNREAMGSVNLRADVETEKFKITIKKMEEDRSDLVSAIVKLKTSINELNQRGRERLLEAFSRVNKKFNEVYTKLFNGGNAKLELVDSDDPLEAGLEMLVSPPGKRLQSITLLSGGEQALTALSLIFAIFLTNPSPICVLDEVDAPLDDANVTRFCSLLDELVSVTKTKFIIITHHALTMSKMDRLYGVTMPEKGVSKLVAVNLQKAEELVA